MATYKAVLDSNLINGEPDGTITVTEGVNTFPGVVDIFRTDRGVYEVRLPATYAYGSVNATIRTKDRSWDCDVFHQETSPSLMLRTWKRIPDGIADTEDGGLENAHLIIFANE